MCTQYRWLHKGAVPTLISAFVMHANGHDEVVEAEIYHYYPNPIFICLLVTIRYLPRVPKESSIRHLFWISPIPIQEKLVYL